MSTDASKLGWGAVRETSSTGGRCSNLESLQNINVLELKAVQFGLRSLCNNEQSSHIRVRADNITAVAHINNMGGIKFRSCYLVAK